MFTRLLLAAFYAVVIVGCGHKHEQGAHEAHNEIKIQYTAYSDNYELFAEADPFVVGETSNILSHFSSLPDFKAVEKGKITIRLNINGAEIHQTLDKPTRMGIYSFDLKPEVSGKGYIKFEILDETGINEVTVSNVTVYSSSESAAKDAGMNSASKVNAATFTKEQSWKINFSTAYPSVEPFGQVIKTTAIVQSSQGSETVITSKTKGIIRISNNALLEGKEIHAGQMLFSVSGDDMTDDNVAVRYAEAKNNYEKLKADYERSIELVNDKIVSEKELLSTKNQYENAKVIYDNLNKNFTASGQTVTSPMNGFVKQFFVKNGSFVEAGEPVLTVSQTKNLILHADVSQRHASILGFINTANIYDPNENRMYTLEQLNGKILSYGKAVNRDNFHIPVIFQIENRGRFIEGGIVDIYLKAITRITALVIPNSALLEEQSGYFVWVQQTPELFEKREVLIGKSDGIKTEVLKGLSVNERIVTRGAMLIKLAQATGTLDAHSGHVH